MRRPEDEQSSAPLSVWERLLEFTRTARERLAELEGQVDEQSVDALPSVSEKLGELERQVAKQSSDALRSLKKEGFWDDAKTGRPVRRGARKGGEAVRSIPHELVPAIIADMEKLRGGSTLRFTGAARDIAHKYDLPDKSGRSVRRLVTRERPGLKW